MVLFFLHMTLSKDNRSSAIKQTNGPVTQKSIVQAHALEGRENSSRGGTEKYPR